MHTDIPSGVLQKTIKLRQLFTLGVGTIVGVAWLMVLGSVIGSAGPVGAVVAFLGGALAMIPIALCYAEVAGLLPFAGGEVVYGYEIFGTRVAFLAGICLAFVYIINCIFFAVSVGWLVNKLLPGFEGPVLYSLLGEALHLGDVAVGLGGTLLIAVANHRGAKAATGLQDVATYALLIATCIFVIAGLATGSVANLKPLIVSPASGSGIAGILGVLAMTPYFFGGFNTIPQAMGELQDAGDRRKVAGVLILCIVVSLAFYALVITAVSMVLPRGRLLSFDLPVAEAFAVAFKSRLLADVVLVAGLVGLVAVWNALFFASTRVLYALGRSRLIQPAFGALHPQRSSPSTAIWFVAIVTMLGIFLGKGVLLPVVNVTSTLFALLYVMVTAGVLRYRRSMPKVSRPYRVPGGGLLVGFGMVFSTYLAILSLYQQYAATPGKWPVEWTLLLAFCICSALLWFMLGAERGRLNEADRRRVILESS